MERPSLEEVKEYFKNATVIESVYNTNGIYSDKNIHIDSEAYFCETENKVCLAIWHKKYGYAKILTYKNTEPKFEITREQILELYNTGYIGPELKKMFPNVFDYKLQIGKWYKRPHNRALFCMVSENENGGVMVYGFDMSGNWMKSKSSNIVQTFKDYEVEATNEEVTEALKNEAVKRGFAKGVWFNSVEPNADGISVVKFGSISNDIFFSNESLFNSRGYIFKNGKWAKIIQTKTIQEAEELLKELGHNFKIV